MRNLKLILFAFVLLFTIGCTDNTENLVTDTTQHTETTNTENTNDSDNARFDTGGTGSGSGQDGGKR